MADTENPDQSRWCAKTKLLLDRTLGRVEQSRQRMKDNQATMRMAHRAIDKSRETLGNWFVTLPQDGQTQEPAERSRPVS